MIANKELFFYRQLMFIEILGLYLQGLKKTTETLKLSNFIQRVLTGAVYIALLLGGVLLGEYTYVALFAIILVLSLMEFYSLLEEKYKLRLGKLFLVAGGLLLSLGAYLYFSSKLSLVLSIIPFLVWLFVLFVSKLYMKQQNTIQSLAYASLGIFYVALPISFASYLAFNYDANIYHFAYLLALFVFIWVNDTFAYLVGSMIGKHRLFERISPKKSWEGFIGGAAFSVLAAIPFSCFFENQPLLFWVGFGCVVVISGTLGDLFESLFKRGLGIKDSGNVLPGHGGILDRFDSMLFAIIPLVIYLEVYGLLFV